MLVSEIVYKIKLNKNEKGFNEFFCFKEKKRRKICYVNEISKYVN